MNEVLDFFFTQISFITINISKYFDIIENFSKNDEIPVSKCFKYVRIMRCQEEI